MRVHCYLDHHGAGEMTSRRSTICSRRNWSMPVSFLLLTRSGGDLLKPRKRSSVIFSGDSYELPSRNRRFSNVFRGKPVKGAQKVGLLKSVLTRLMTLTEDD
jgi:hypothetical protein